MEWTLPIGGAGGVSWVEAKDFLPCEKMQECTKSIQSS